MARERMAGRLTLRLRTLYSPTARHPTERHPTEHHPTARLMAHHRTAGPAAAPTERRLGAREPAVPTAGPAGSTGCRTDGACHRGRTVSTGRRVPARRAEPPAATTAPDGLPRRGESLKRDASPRRGELPRTGTPTAGAGRPRRRPAGPPPPQAAMAPADTPQADTPQADHLTADRLTEAKDVPVPRPRDRATKDRQPRERRTRDQATRDPRPRELDTRVRDIPGPRIRDRRRWDRCQAGPRTGSRRTEARRRTALPG